MIFYGLLGLEFSQNSFTLHPYLPDGIDHLVLHDLKIGNGEYTVLIERDTDSPTSATIPKSIIGKQTIKLSYHKELSMESNWRTCKVKDLHVEPLDGTSPL